MNECTVAITALSGQDACRVLHMHLGISRSWPLHERSLVVSANFQTRKVRFKVKRFVHAARDGGAFWTDERVHKCLLNDPAFLFSLSSEVQRHPHPQPPQCHVGFPPETAFVCIQFKMTDLHYSPVLPLAGADRLSETQFPHSSN